MYAKWPLVMALGSSLVLVGCYYNRYPEYPRQEAPSFFWFGHNAQTVSRPAPPPVPPAAPRPRPPQVAQAPMTRPLPPVASSAPVTRRPLMAPQVLPGLARFNTPEAAANADTQETIFRHELGSSGVDIARDGNLVILSIGQGILFAAGSSELNPPSRAVLSDIAKVLNRYPSTRIDIGGFTDSTGTRGLNLKLSQDRADAVAHVLMGDGVEPSRITAKGYGPEFPKVPAAQGVPEPRNRRVEITLVPVMG
jgi:outer membrane protein OmpA-like peptidoglycan-associated protein